jgi:GMP synthase (glutamine-hydrolysing)
MQWMAHQMGGRVEAGERREYGVESMQITSGEVFKGLPQEISVLMSHGDHVVEPPKDFIVSARSRSNLIAALEHKSLPLFGLQFHPEVRHSPQGLEILKNFLSLCEFTFDWKPQQIFDQLAEALRKQVGKEGRILCALSGGVDSAVVALILHRIFPGRVDSLCVDTGLLRKGELEDLVRLFAEKFHFSIKTVDASKEFLVALKGVSDPEQKRKIIGKVFIDVFAAHALELSDARYLAQGTLYPDVIESISFHGGPSVTIKSHHNVGGLPEHLPFELIEPLRDLFKDEVRRLGEYLGLPHEFLWRHPFPGPGLAIRIMGDVTDERLQILREADWRLQEELKSAGWYERLWQSFCVYLPISSVGVMGDQRTYEHMVAVRCVHSEDGMTAHAAPLEPALLERISQRLIGEVRGINRVVYDISSKPPATIEWE